MFIDRFAGAEGSKTRSCAPLLVAALALPMLAGCGGLGSALGLTKSAPDEFAVVTKAPLVLPPDYSLRPPQPGAPRPQEPDPTERARDAVFAETGIPGEAQGVSSAETAILSATGAEEADPNIRRVISEESTALLEKDRTFADNILFWRGEPTEPAEVVDAAAEAERIRRQQTAGDRVTGEGAPTISRDGGGFF